MSQSNTLLKVLAMAASLIVAVGGFLGCIGAGATGDASDSARRQTPLDELPKGEITANGQTIRVWIANRDETRTEGLMFVPADQIADDQGMLFVFPREQYLGFWMLNTVTELDIAFARTDGTIVKTWRMPPLTIQTFPSIEPALFALEMKAGAFERLGLKEGDTLNIPQELFKTEP